MAAPLSSKLDWETANPLWASSINPILGNPLNNAQIISGIKLISGNTTVNHNLGRLPNGWFQVDITGAVQYYRSAPYTAKTITFTANGLATLSIGVF